MFVRFFLGYILYVLAPLGKISISTGWDKEGHRVQSNQNWGLEDDTAVSPMLPVICWMPPTITIKPCLPRASTVFPGWWRVPKVSQYVRQPATKHNFLLGYEQGVLGSQQPVPDKYLNGQMLASLKLYIYIHLRQPSQPIITPLKVPSKGFDHRMGGARIM